jgi:hypothetical protein
MMDRFIFQWNLWFSVYGQIKRLTDLGLSLTRSIWFEAGILDASRLIVNGTKDPPDQLAENGTIN